MYSSEDSERFYFQCQTEALPPGESFQSSIMDKLKFFFHISLIILNAFSLIILLQVVFQALPCWDCDWPTDKITRVNDMAKDFSITVISSTIFYFLLVVIPDGIKRSFIRKRTQTVIDRIVNDMQEIIAYLAYKCSIAHQSNEDPHYLKLNPKGFDAITDFSRNNLTGFYYSCCQNGKKELTNVSNWDEISFLYPRVRFIKQMIANYRDIPVIVYEDPNLIFLTRKIEQSTFISHIEMKHSISIGIIPHTNEGVKSFYSLYQELFPCAKHVQELHVGDEDAARIIPIAVKC